MSLHRALLRRPEARIDVALGEAVRQASCNVDSIDPVPLLVVNVVYGQFDLARRDVALLTEREDVVPGARPDRREEQLERTRRRVATDQPPMAGPLLELV